MPDRFLNPLDFDLFFPRKKKHHLGTFDKLRRRLLEELASEVEQATERALRRLWDERDGVAAEGGGG